jgi:hypothetical protein
MAVVITYKTKATACRALTFIVRVFVNDSIAVAVWTSFDTIRHSILEAQCSEKRSPGRVRRRGNLAPMFALIEGQSFVQISSRVLHEVGLGLLAAKAVGLALERRIDRAIRLYVFVVGKAPGTLVVELASCGISRGDNA